MPVNVLDDLRSLEQQVALLPDESIDQLIAEIDAYLLEYSWQWTARADQYAATVDTSRIVGVIGGRGSGKTRTGAEWVRHRINTKPPGAHLRFGFVARTAADVRDTMVQGESGILSVFPPSETPTYTASARRVDFVDGSEALMLTAEVPGQIRGPQFHYGWADELAAWDLRPDNSGANAWDNLLFATRLGKREGIKAQILFTTTPKRLKMLREILEKAKAGRRYSVYNQAGTAHNIHLDEEVVADLLGVYGGTRLALQELHGILSDKVEGAMWSEDLLNSERVRTYDDPGKLPIRVIGVDPSTAENPRDECGIIALGATPRQGPVLKRTGYILGDYSGLMPPKKWKEVVVEAALKHDAYVIAEANQGGALVKEVIHGVNPDIKVVLVTASVSKKMRAEPVAMATEQGRLKIFRRYPELEDQMTTWVPDEDTESPDRVDALVHAAAGIITIIKKKVGSGGHARVSNPGKGRNLGVSVATRR